MQETKDLSLNDFFRLLKKGINFIYSKIVILTIVFISSGLCGFLWMKLFYKPKYKADITFTLEQKSNMTAGALSGLANSLGIGDLAGGSQSGMFGGENILYLLKSNRIIHQSLKEPNSELKGGHLLNEYLKSHFYKEIENKQIKLFPKNLVNIKFSREQDSIILLITKQIQQNQIVAERQDNKTSIIKLEVIDINENWAYIFSQSLMKNAINLYLDIKIGKLLKTEQELTQKKDSIRGLLDGSINTLALETDLNSHTPLMRYKTKQAKKQIDVEVLKNMYANVIQNLEITKFQRAQQEPIIEIIDSPILPLEVKKLSSLSASIIASVIGTFLFLIVLFSIFLLKKFNQINSI